MTDRISHSIRFQPLWYVFMITQPERSINKAENESNQKKYKSFSKTEKKKMSYFQCAATLISKFMTAPEIAGRTSRRGLPPK